MRNLKRNQLTAKGKKINEGNTNLPPRSLALRGGEFSTGAWWASFYRKKAMQNIRETRPINTVYVPKLQKKKNENTERKEKAWRSCRAAPRVPQASEAGAFFRTVAFERQLNRRRGSGPSTGRRRERERNWAVIDGIVEGGDRTKADPR